MAMQWNGPQITQAVTAGAIAGLNKGAERLRAATIPRTPLDRGDLRASLTVVPATTTTLQAAVVTNLPYAGRQHEEVGYHHNDGEAKFLENAAYAEESTIQAIIAQHIRSHS